MNHRRLNARQTRAVQSKIPIAMLLGMRLARLHADGITLECAINDDLLNSDGRVGA